MSYILDALRKADAQRERDASRGIHAQPASAAATRGRAGASSRIATFGAVAAGIVVAAAAGWYFTRGELAPTDMRLTPPGSPSQPPVVAKAAPAAEKLPPAMPVQMQPPQAVANAIVPPAAPAIPPRDPTNTSLPPMRGIPQANFVPGMSSDQAARQAREAAFSKAAQAMRPGAPVTAAAPAAQPAPAAPAAAPAQAPAAQPAGAAVTGLPPDAPKVAISGGVYSPSPAQRMLIVNGQVFNEGSEVAPGVAIEKIEARTAILKFRGARYTVAY